MLTAFDRRPNKSPFKPRHRVPEGTTKKRTRDKVAAKDRARGVLSFGLKARRSPPGSVTSSSTGPPCHNQIEQAMAVPSTNAVRDRSDGIALPIHKRKPGRRTADRSATCEWIEVQTHVDRLTRSNRSAWTSNTSTRRLDQGHMGCARISRVSAGKTP